ncbi:uncharacterized protein LOC116207368 [Punica granatum]|uniref:Uncharacterized protein LOC116207368 n=1 Tax=Punica granatum TaxID=22663 RepID=A0A6P8DI31_PUNGR|nr:uncharacterized protein LOC116207368 [Punica granatum]
MLNKAAVSGRLSYHPYCAKVQLTHLGFADDVIIFLKGEERSFRAVLRVFEEFFQYLGLKLNSSKTEVYFAGMSQKDVSDMLKISSLRLGTLPVKYLGVPLVPGRLTDKECKPLIEKIFRRINSWRLKNLSFAGILQLVSSVIYSLVNFWCRAFILPKKVIIEVERKCKAYLWKGTDSDARGARDDWDTVCFPKKEGTWNVLRHKREKVEWYKFVWIHPFCTTLDRVL